MERMATARAQPHLQRYKGLGEMNPEQLWETTMDPEARQMMLVGADDEWEADGVIKALMGDAVLPRKEFIQAHARNVLNLGRVRSIMLPGTSTKDEVHQASSLMFVLPLAIMFCL